MRVRILVSATEAEAARLQERGPRRDFVELARALGGEMHYRPAPPAARRGPLARLRARLFGPHVRHAWRAAAETERGDVLFADGEHVGIPLLGFLALRRRRPARVAMIGHLPGRLWKRALLRVLTRVGPPGRLLVHSVEQARLVEHALGRRWELRLIPYQVDTSYWRPEAAEATRDVDRDEPPLIVAVGSEHRDYETLIAAADRQKLRVVIAAGSHWARDIAGAEELPRNVEYLDQPLPFQELRELYARASMVVVPLAEVPNQSGVTTILEAMSMSRPVVVSASTGQQECVRGPLVTAVGGHDHRATAERGPGVFNDASGAGTLGQPSDCGLYVPVGEPGALRSAILTLLADDELRTGVAAAGREVAVRHFPLERFTVELARAITDESGAEAPATRAAQRAVRRARQLAAGGGEA